MARANQEVVLLPQMDRAVRLSRQVELTRAAGEHHEHPMRVARVLLCEQIRDRCPLLERHADDLFVGACAGRAQGGEGSQQQKQTLDESMDGNRHGDGVSQSRHAEANKGTRKGLACDGRQSTRSHRGRPAVNGLQANWPIGQGL